MPWLWYTTPVQIVCLVISLIKSHVYTTCVPPQRMISECHNIILRKTDSQMGVNCHLNNYISHRIASEKVVLFVFSICYSYVNTKLLQYWNGPKSKYQVKFLGNWYGVKFLFKSNCQNSISSHWYVCWWVCNVTLLCLTHMHWAWVT